MANHSFYVQSCCTKLPSILPKSMEDNQWSLLQLGTADWYHSQTGMDQEGFLPNYTQLMTWDFAQPLDTNFPKLSRDNSQPKEEKRLYLGLEYECPTGHRTILSPHTITEVFNWTELVQTITPNQYDLNVAKMVANKAIPLHLSCQCSKSAQLQRLYLVNHQVEGVYLKPCIKTQARKLSSTKQKKESVFEWSDSAFIPPDSAVCLRFPYIYLDATDKYINPRHFEFYLQPNFVKLEAE